MWVATEDLPQSAAHPARRAALSRFESTRAMQGFERAITTSVLRHKHEKLRCTHRRQTEGPTDRCILSSRAICQGSA